MAQDPPQSPSKNPLPSLFTSRKTLRVFFGSLIIIGGLYFTWPMFTTPDAKMKAYVGAVVTIAGLFGVDIHGIAKEDAAQKQGTSMEESSSSTPASPASQQAQTPPPPPPTPAPAPAPATPAPERPLMVTINPVSMKAIVAAVVSELKSEPPAKPITNTGV